MADLEPRPAPLAVSASAARRIAKVLQAEARPEAKLRVSVSGGGCSGFQYIFAVDDKCEDGDIIVERDGAAVVVDGMSLMYVIGAELDYVEDLTGSYFRVKKSERQLVVRLRDVVRDLMLPCPADPVSKLRDQAA